MTYDAGSASNDPALYYNGSSTSFSNAARGSGTVNTNSDAYVIGNRGNDGARPFIGSIEWWTKWSVILNANEIAALARGVHPYRIRPESIVSCCPIWGRHDPEIDLVEANGTATVTGTSVPAHGPPLTLFTPRWISQPEIGAGGGGDTNVNLDKFSLTWSGKTGYGELLIPTSKVSVGWTGGIILPAYSVTLDKSSLVWSGKTVTAQASVPVAKSSLAWTGGTAQGDVSVPMAKASLALDMGDVEAVAQGSVAVDKASLTWTGSTVFGAVSVAVAKAALAFSGSTLTAQVSVPITKFTLALTGKTVTALANLSIVMDKFVLAWTGGTVDSSYGVLEYCRGIVRALVRPVARALTRRTSC
jgi:hypothetical protein